METNLTHPDITLNMNPNRIKHRLVTCFQSSGRIGKSTVMEGIIAWAQFAGVPLATVDCDAEHKTLSQRFPSATFVDATRSNDDFLRLIKEMPDLPLALADFPAQATGFLLDALESLSVLDVFDERETRLTVLMFGSDDPTAMMSMAKTYLALGDRADYLLVKNPARFRSKKFDESAIADVFKRKGVPVLELPAITDTTLSEMERASEEAEKHLTFTEAAKLKSISDICRFEIEYFINRMLTQCEDAARVLVPDPALIKNKVFRPGAKLSRRVPKEFNPLGAIHE
jgi:hypothetical protein